MGWEREGTEGEWRGGKGWGRKEVKNSNKIFVSYVFVIFPLRLIFARIIVIFQQNRFYLIEKRRLQIQKKEK